MPRPNPLRMMASEANLARRIGHERERRGWTYEGLAKRMTDAGCAIQGSAIYKVEKATPPRRITVDELVALAQVFELDVEDLLKPVDLVGDREATEITDEWLAAQRQIVGSVLRAEELAERLEALARSGNLREFPVYSFINDGLFGAVREAQSQALIAFEVFHRVHDAHVAYDEHTSELVARVRARSGVDEAGRAHHDDDDGAGRDPETGAMSMAEGGSS